MPSTSPHFRPHEFPHRTAHWWLVSWTTYGSWLPGDPRGFYTWREREYIPPPKRYAEHGEESYNPSPYRERHEQAMAATEEVVQLSEHQRRTVIAGMVNAIFEMPLRPAIIAVGAWHVHFLSQFGVLEIRSAVGDIKAGGTKALWQSGQRIERVWAKGCHMKSKRDRKSYDYAYAYIKRHVEQGCLIHEWEIDDVYLPSQ